MGRMQTTTVLVELAIRCREPADAFRAVDNALDAGLLQDAVSEPGAIKVISATTYAAPTPQTARCRPLRLARGACVVRRSACLTYDRQRWGGADDLGGLSSG